MAYESRSEQIQKLFPDIKPFRLRQIEHALYDVRNSSWDTVSTLPQDMRKQVTNIPWISHKVVKVFESKNRDTFKAVLETLDGNKFETVLMQNKRGSWTLCVSSQIGCAMACVFCATGTMGLTRSLDADEIVDQYRFWQGYLAQHFQTKERISNMVFMGMGEPLQNYENVKKAIHSLLAHTDLGKTRIMVSSVGVVPVLNKILEDKDWPQVRIAISLHSANPIGRKAIVPTSFPQFLDRLAEWTQNYSRILGNRRHYITFEYILLQGVNDDEATAKELGTYMLRTAARKINVMPYNAVPGKPFSKSQAGRIDAFKKVLRDMDINVTQRRSMGEDIAAACGQLVYQDKK